MKKPVLSVILALNSFLAAASVERISVDFDYVRQLAAERVGAPFPPTLSTLARRLVELPAEDVHAIRFLPERALWNSERLPFQIWFEHPAMAPMEPMTLHEFSATHTQVIPFVGELFDTGTLH